MKTIKILFINFGKLSMRGGESQIVWETAKKHRTIPVLFAGEP